MGRLAGKRILVLGAGGNLGSQVASAYLDQGASLVLSSRSFARIDEIAASAGADGAVALPADLRDNASIDALVRSAWDCFGGSTAYSFRASLPILAWATC